MFASSDRSWVCGSRWDWRGVTAEDVQQVGGAAGDLAVRSAGSL